MLCPQTWPTCFCLNPLSECERCVHRPGQYVQAAAAAAPGPGRPAGEHGGAHQNDRTGCCQEPEAGQRKCPLGNLELDILSLLGGVGLGGKGGEEGCWQLNEGEKLVP